MFWLGELGTRLNPWPWLGSPVSAILPIHGGNFWVSGPKGLMDAYLAMIPFVDGDSTPSCQRSLCVLPVVCRLWASLRLSHLKERVQNWIPQSVFSLGNGVSSVEAWFSTALYI